MSDYIVSQATKRLIRHITVKQIIKKYVLKLTKYDTTDEKILIYLTFINLCANITCVQNFDVKKLFSIYLHETLWHLKCMASYDFTTQT